MLTAGAHAIANPTGRPSLWALDASWCWWTRPRVTVHGDDIYLGGVQYDGSIVAVRAKVGGEEVQRFTLGDFEGDDHNNPALYVPADRPPIAIYTRHTLDNLVRIRVGTTALDITAWGAEQTVTLAGLSSYQALFVSGDRLVVLTRDDRRYWTVLTSADYGATWGTPVRLFDAGSGEQTYTAATQVGDTIRIAFTGHPDADKAVHDIYYCEMNMATGAVTAPVAGAVGNAYTGTGLPGALAAFDKVYTVDPTRTTQLFDISDGPEPELAFATKVRDDLTTTDAIYHYGVRSAGTWSFRDVAAAGTIFGYNQEGMYLGGMSFPPSTPGGTLVLSREADGLWTVERYTDAAGSWTVGTLTPWSTRRQVRPWCIDAARTAVMQLTYYHGDYTDVTTSLMPTDAPT